jgi:hypothetical protein
VGNFNVFLNYFMRQVYLPANPLVKQYWYTTSPPVSIPQVSNGGRISVGNMEFLGDPHVIMGSRCPFRKFAATPRSRQSHKTLYFQGI